MIYCFLPVKGSDVTDGIRMFSENCLLVVNSDDVGYASIRDAGIIDGVRAGAISSLSVMTNGASAEDAIRNAVSLASKLSIGLHINLTEGCPVLPASRVHSLVDDATAALPVMRGKMGFREAIAAGRVDLDHVRAELEAQVDRFVALHPLHVLPEHADGHQHVHVLPGVCEVIAEVVAAKGIRCVRLPALCDAEEPDVVDMALEEPSRAAFYRDITGQCALARPVFERAGLFCADIFLGYTLMGKQMQAERLLRLLDRLLDSSRRLRRSSSSTLGAVHAHATGAFTSHSKTAGVACAELSASRPLLVELMCHPGHSVPLGTPASEAGCGHPAGADDFAMSADREHELDVLCSSELAEGLRARRVRIVTWPQLRAAGKPGTT